MKQEVKCELYNDNFQNFKRYGIPRAQLVIADIPYNLGRNAYASNPSWYKGGDRNNGESKKANKGFFNSDFNFNIVEYFHFCNKLLKKEPKEKGTAPCMIVFCSFEQMHMVIETAQKYGFKKYIPLTFIKNSSPQALKANMRIVGATERALVLFRDKLPKFNNGRKVDENGRNIKGTGRMILDWMNWERDKKGLIPKIHPTQKPVNVLKKLIEIYTDEGDVVIDPVAGSGATLRASKELNRHSFGFEIYRPFVKKAKEEMLNFKNKDKTLFDYLTKENKQ